jgi:hypothetical protein
MATVEASVTVPYTLRIQRAADLLALERDMRTLLQCQGRMCAFLQSAEYCTFKIHVHHALHGASCPEGGRAVMRTMHIAGSTLVMHVSQDGLSVVVQSRLPTLHTKNPSKEARRCGADAMEGALLAERLLLQQQQPQHTTTTVTTTSDDDYEEEEEEEEDPPRVSPNKRRRPNADAAAAKAAVAAAMWGPPLSPLSQPRVSPVPPPPPLPPPPPPLLPPGLTQRRHYLLMGTRHLHAAAPPPPPPNDSDDDDDSPSPLSSVPSSPVKPIGRRGAPTHAARRFGMASFEPQLRAEEEAAARRRGGGKGRYRRRPKPPSPH